MGLFKTIKCNALHALSGAWGRAIGVVVLAGLPALIINTLETGLRKMSGVSSFLDYAGTPGSMLDDRANMLLISLLITGMISILLFIITTPLQQGLTRWYYRRTGGRDESVTELFWYFESAKSYGKSLWLHFQIGLRTLLWSLLICIPFGLCETVLILIQQKLGADAASPALTIWTLLTIAVGILTGIFILLISLRYFLAPYLFAEYPDIKARQAIHDSVKIMRGHKGSLFLFELSFILWFLPMVLCLISLILMMIAPGYFIGLMPVILLMMFIQLGLSFYLVPYLHTSCGLYARYLIQKAAGGAEPFLKEEDTSTREYEAYKPEIDRYMEEQRAAQGEEPTAETFPSASVPEEPPKDEF